MSEEESKTQHAENAKAELETAGPNPPDLKNNMPLTECQRQGMAYWHFEEELINKRVAWLAVFQSLLFSGLVLSGFQNLALFKGICIVGMATSSAGLFGVLSGIFAQYGWGRRYELGRIKGAFLATLLGWASPVLLVGFLCYAWWSLLNRDLSDFQMHSGEKNFSVCVGFCQAD